METAAWSEWGLSPRSAADGVRSGQNTAATASVALLQAWGYAHIFLLQDAGLMAVFNKSQSCPMRWEEAIKDVSLFRDFVCFLTEHLQEKKLRKTLAIIQ